jgi:hypothetical protein
VGEGYSAISNKLSWVRGWLRINICIRGEKPLIRRYAPPSPTSAFAKASADMREEGTF